MFGNKATWTLRSVLGCIKRVKIYLSISIFLLKETHLVLRMQNSSKIFVLLKNISLPFIVKMQKNRKISISIPTYA